MRSPGLAQAIDESHQALDRFVAGDPDPLKALYSRRADATLANPFGPPARGWRNVARTMESAAGNYRDGHASGFERVSAVEGEDLACIVEIERYRSKIGRRTELASVALRVTTVFRREERGWRIAHRHADPTVTPQPADVVLGPRVDQGTPAQRGVVAP